MVWSDDVFANEVQTEWRQALPGIIAGKPDRTDLMRSTIRAIETPVSMKEILSAVSHESEFTAPEITGHKVSVALADARALVVYLAHDLRPDLTQSQIARTLKKDRATVRLAQRRAKRLMDSCSGFVHQHAHARKRLGLA